MEIKGIFVLNAAPIGILQISIPSGYSVNSSYRTSKLVNGYAVAQKDDPTGFNYVGVIDMNTSGTTFSIRGDSTTQGGLWNASIPATFASGHTISVHAFLPITGWSSSVLMSDSADTRVVAASYTFTNASAIPNASSTNLSSTYVTYSRIHDTHSAFNTTNGSYTIPVAGKYRINSKNEFTAYAAGIRYTQAAQTGSVSFSPVLSAQEGSSSMNILSGSVELDCQAGDVIQFKAYQNSGVSLNLAPSGSAWNQLDISRISGPNQIAASETISARYSTNAGNSIANLTTLGIFPPLAFRIVATLLMFTLNLVMV
jgi:hypothetical protein